MDIFELSKDEQCLVPSAAGAVPCCQDTAGKQHQSIIAAWVMMRHQRAWFSWSPLAWSSAGHGSSSSNQLLHKCKLILFLQVSDCSERHQSWAIKKGKKRNTSRKASFGYPKPSFWWAVTSPQCLNPLRIYRLGSKCLPEQNTKGFLANYYKLQCAITLTEKKGLFWENKNPWWQKNLISLKNDGCKKTMWQEFRQENILTWADT